MAKPIWTDEQRQAIAARGCNVLVSAAAGSGKTAVLTERVMQRLLDETDPVLLDRLLIVTFTNAAAAEMRERITNALTAFVAEYPDHSRAAYQLSLLPGAKICTIDSFCINLVRDHFFKLGIEQDFTILEDSQRAVMEQTVAEEIVERLYADDDETFRDLVELLCTTKNDNELIRAVRRIDNYISSQPFPLEWLEETALLYSPDIPFDSSRLKAYVTEEIRCLISYIKEIITHTVSVLYPEDELFEKYSAVLEEDMNTVSVFEASLDGAWDDIRLAAQSVNFSKTPYKRGYTSNVKETLTDNRKIYAGSAGVFTKEILPMLSASSEEIQQDNVYLYPLLQKLTEMVSAFHEGVMALKKEVNAYSFSDIEHFAIDLLFERDESGTLHPSEAAMELENSLDEILVDEYQDTNAAQNTLFEMLSNGFNRFMVGDVKQSIYRFRLAEPRIFNEMKDRFVPYESPEISADRKVILGKNFRSRSGICNFTNYVFSKLMSRRTGEMEYLTEDYLHGGAVYPSSDVPSVQLYLVQPPEEANAREFEAHQLAQYILEKVNGGELIKDGDILRPIGYGDIAVLLRSAKSSLPVYSKILNEYGIPVLADNRTNLFDTNEVSVLLSFLRVIDNPMQDVPLLSTLLSVFYGFTPDDVAHARVHYKAGNLYASVCQDSERFQRFLDDLSRYRGYAATMCVEDFLRQLLSDTAYLSVISAMGNGEQRRLNVMKLVELARRFDCGENVGLTAFMRYIDSVTEAKLVVDGADTSYITGDKVQLMSVHKSKGLEFPVCILADAAHQYNKDDLNDPILLNNRYGVGLKVNNEEGLYRYNSVQYDCIRAINRQELMSENLRVLYVAITRAKEQFVCFATVSETAVNHLSKKIVGSKIHPVTVSKAQSDAQLLVMCALQHPDAAVLRAMCHTDVPVDSAFPFTMKVSISDKPPQTAEQAAVQMPYNETLTQRIAERLSYRYERSDLAAYASKRTASSLDESETGYQYVATSQPAFLNRTGLTPAERGTAMHTFMQYCDYAAAKADLGAEIERLTAAAFLTQEQADALNRDKLRGFFCSEFAERMSGSNRVYRELKVASFVPLSALEPTDYHDPVLVQGIADCVFEEDGELVLVDYKTDKADSEQELLDRYKNQVAFYKNAVAKTLQMPVKEAMLYSFYLEKVCIYK